MNEEIMKTSMEIIINAGDARLFIHKALKAIAESNYALAAEEMDSAKKKMIEAHKIHTNVIQSEARGEEIEYTILFTHAQDTLMTINSEMELTNSLINVFKSFEERIKKLEEGK